MSQGTAVLLGAIAGITIFLGLPVARMHGLPKPVQGFLNAFATGILIFILWDILAHASGPVEAALVGARTGPRTPFVWMASIFAVGIAAGLLGLPRTGWPDRRRPDIHWHVDRLPRELKLPVRRLPGDCGGGAALRRQRAVSRGPPAEHAASFRMGNALWLPDRLRDRPRADLRLVGSATHNRSRPARCRPTPGSASGTAAPGSRTGCRGRPARAPSP